MDAKTEFESADFWTIANYRSHIGYFTVPELASRTGLAADKIESELAFLREQEVVMLTGTARGLPEYRFIAEYEASGSESEYFVVNGLPLCRKCRDGVHGHHLDHGCKVTFHKDSRNLGQCNCWISDRKETAFRKRWQQVSEQRSKASTSV